MYPYSVNLMSPFPVSEPVDPVLTPAVRWLCSRPLHHVLTPFVMFCTSFSNRVSQLLMEKERKRTARDRGRPGAADKEVSVRDRLVKRLGHLLTAGDWAVRSYLITSLHRSSTERVFPSLMCLGFNNFTRSIVIVSMSPKSVIHSTNRFMNK